MITGGIDVGTRNTKVVVLDEDQILGYSTVPTGTDVNKSVEKALGASLKSLELTRNDIESFGVTGAGRKHVGFAREHATQVVADAKGISWLLPSVGTVIDVGAEHSLAVKCNAEGKPLDFVTNEKCAAGVGSFVDNMSKALETRLEEMEGLASKSLNEVDMNITCVVFAESEVVSLIHSGVPREDIVRAILGAIASRTTSMTRRLDITEDVAMIGGVARNNWVVAFVKNQLGVDIIVPENPELVGALGAALVARG